MNFIKESKSSKQKKKKKTLKKIHFFLLLFFFVAGGGGGSYCYTIQKSNHLHNVEHVVLQPILFILKSVNNSNFELSSKRISTKYLKFKSYFFLWPGCGGGWGVETKAVWQMFKCGTIQISNHLHTVEHVVQSKSEKKKHIFLCVGGGGGVWLLL